MKSSPDMTNFRAPALPAQSMSQSSPLEWWRPAVVAEGGDRSLGVASGRSIARGNAVPFRALMGLTFIILLAPQSFFPALAPWRIALLTAAVAAGGYLVDRFSRRRPIVIPTLEVKLAACLAGWAVLTVPFSYWPGGSVSTLVDLYFKSLVVFWLVSHAVDSPQRLRQTAWGLSLMAVPLAATAVSHYRSGVFAPVEGEKRIIGYEAPLTENPNDLALMLNLLLPLTVALWAAARSPMTRAALAAIVLLDVAAIILTFSRAGFLTLVTIGLMYLMKRWRSHGPLWAAGILALALLSLPLLPSAYLERLGTITSIEADETGSSQIRWQDTVAAAEFVARSPIVGAGAGLNTLALNEVRGPTWKMVHNVYLEHAVELGLPGLVLFLWLLVACLRATTLAQRRSRAAAGSRELFYLAEGTQVSLVAFAVAGLFHPVAYHFYFYYIAGLALALKHVTGWMGEATDGPGA